MFLFKAKQSPSKLEVKHKDLLKSVVCPTAKVFSSAKPPAMLQALKERPRGDNYLKTKIFSS